MKTYWGSGGTAPCILDLGTRWRWVVSFTPWLLYPRERAPGTQWIVVWVGPRAMITQKTNIWNCIFHNEESFLIISGFQCWIFEHVLLLHYNTTNLLLPYQKSVLFPSLLQTSGLLFGQTVTFDSNLHLELSIPYVYLFQRLIHLSCIKLHHTAQETAKTKTINVHHKALVTF